MQILDFHPMIKTLLFLSVDNRTKQVSHATSLVSCRQAVQARTDPSGVDPISSSSYSAKCLYYHPVGPSTASATAVQILPEIASYEVARSEPSPTGISHTRK